MGFAFFAENDCSAAVIETGLGGRLDSTNVLAPELTVITALGLDHQHILGDTLADIAREKGGIIKPGVPCVVAAQTEAAQKEALPVLARIARERGAELIHAEDAGDLSVLEMTQDGARLGWKSGRVEGRKMDLRLPLIGAHQAKNLHAALAAVEMLESKGWRIGEDAIRRGVADARIPARCEVIGTDPPIVLDGAHCPLSMRATVDTLKDLWPHRKVIACYSCLSDKNARATLAELARLPALERVIVFPAPSPRACPPETIEAAARDLGMPAFVKPSAQSAMEQAMSEAGPSSLVLATGSLYSAAQLRDCYEKLVHTTSVGTTNSH